MDFIYREIHAARIKHAHRNIPLVYRGN
jgi:hypothetical protein